MRVLVITGDLDVTGTHPWLVDDLVAALVGLGADVEVVRADPRRQPATTDERTALSYTLVDLVPPGWMFSPRLARSLTPRGAALARRAWCSVRLLGAGRRGGRALPSGPGTYDVVVQFSIGALNAGLPARLRRRGVARSSVFVMWDFFPVHQLEIGHLPRVPVVPEVLRRLERRAVSSADAVAVMSERNREFLEDYLDVRPHTFVVPPWSTSGDETGLPARRRERFTVVFGGQLTAGRDLDLLLDAAARMRDTGVLTDFVVVGDGPARAALEERARREGLDHVSFLGRLPREDYRRVAAGCHVGLSVTSAQVSVPSFPSKIPEFLGLGLPVVAATEDTTDAGEFVESRGVGLAARSADVASVVTALTTLAQEHAEGRLAERSDLARRVWREEFSVESAARRILEAAGAVQPT